MLPGLGLGADAKTGHHSPDLASLLAGWSEYEVLMETPLSAGLARRTRIARYAESGCHVAYGEAAHG
jgi:hypothetical protein